jgi:Fe-S cluster biogenesis protein NfuA
MSLPADADDLKSRVAHVLTNEIRPALHMDGGDIEVVDVSDGIVRVRLLGTCSGCPSAIMAVMTGIELELRKRIPEIEYLEAVP